MVAQDPIAYDPLTGEPIKKPVPAPPTLGQVMRSVPGVLSTTFGPSVRSQAQRERDADMVTNALPALGGLAGGALGSAVGPVGSIALASVGGSAGEALKQGVDYLRGKPPVGGLGAANKIAVEGGVQGAAQAAGLGLSKFAAGSAKWLMNRSLNLTDKLAREFPGMADAMIEKAITVSKGGMSAATDFLRAAKAEANAALSQAHAAGATVPIDRALDGLAKTQAETVLNSADIAGGIKTLAAIEKKLRASRGATLTPMEADALKRSLQLESKALYAARKMGTGKPSVTVKAQAKADMAASLNRAISDITDAAGAPGYRAANAEAQSMMGVTRGISRGMRPGSNLYQAMVRPGVGAVVGGTVGYRRDGVVGGMAGTVAGAALMSPTGMSRLSIALSNPAVQSALKQAPRLANALLNMATSHAPSVTPVSSHEQSVTRADIEAVAAQNGTTYAVEEARAKGEGFVIR